MKFLPVLAALALAGTALAAENFGGSLSILLGNESVQKELNLTSLQRAVLEDIRNEYREDSRAIVAQVAVGAESKKAARAQLEALTAAADRRAEHALSSAQRKRLQEIRHQILGGYMVLSPFVQAKLGITPAQKAKIAKIEQRSQKNIEKVNTAFETGKITYYQRMMSLRQNRIDRSQELFNLLTSEQYGKLAALEGEEFPGQG
jgi:hypothetical protein